MSAGQTEKTTRKPKIAHLPEFMKDSFTSKFMPMYLEHLGTSANPWITTPDTALLESIVQEVYPTATNFKVTSRSQLALIVSHLYHLSLIFHHYYITCRLANTAISGVQNLVVQLFLQSTGGSSRRR